jgi:hypothetical protein
MKAALVLVVIALAGCSSSSGGDVATVVQSTVPTTSAETQTTVPVTLPATTTQPPDTTSAPTTSSSSTSTTTTTIPIDYGQQYRDLITPLNCAGDALNSGLEAVAPDGFTDAEWPNVREPITAIWAEYALRVVDTVQAFVIAGWPDDLQEDIDSLVDEISQLASRADTFARSETFDDYLYAESQPELPHAVATVIRAKLGIETNIGVAGYDCS